MNNFDEIGLFKGEPISQMTREELLDFARWASKRLEELFKIERETEDFRIRKEIESI